LNGYTMESTMAEKFQAMVKLGVLNSRMKDFYDIWMLARTFDFKGEVLSKAVEKTFEKRHTPITIAPTVFDPSFVKDGGKKVQWQGFIRKAKLVDAPESSVGIKCSLISPALCERATRWTYEHASRRRAGPQGTCGAHWRSVSDRGCLFRRHFTQVVGTYVSMLDSIRFSYASRLVLFAMRASVSPAGPRVTGFQAHRASRLPGSVPKSPGTRFLVRLAAIGPYSCSRPMSETGS
jgi:hypothetical protein